MIRVRVPLVILLVLAPAFASGLPGDSRFVVDFHVEGFDDHVTYPPARGGNERDSSIVWRVGAPDVTHPNAARLPREQWLWVNLTVTTWSGLPLAEERVTLNTQGLEESFYWGGYTDAHGHVSFLAPAPAADRVVIAVNLPDGSSRVYEWATTEAHPDATRPVLVRPDDEWVALRFDIHREARFDASFFGYVFEPMDAPVVAVVYELGMERDGRRAFGNALLGTWDPGHDVTVRPLAHAPVAVEASAPVVDEVFGMSSWAGRRGTFEAGDAVTIVLGRVGLEEYGGMTFRFFGPRDAYTVTELGRGNLSATLARAESVEAASETNHGLAMGNYVDARAAVPADADALVIADVYHPRGSVSVARVTHDDAVYRKVLVDREWSNWWTLTRMGACGGAWDLDVVEYEGRSRPSVALAVADAPPLNDWVKRAFDVGDAGCALPE